MKNAGAGETQRRIRELAKRDIAGLRGKDFLLSWERSLEELVGVMETARLLRELRGRGLSTRVWDSGLAISQFRDKSTRTRFSFASAANLLGLAVQELEEGKSQLAHGETVRETSVMVSFMAEAVGIRDDMYIGRGHAYMLEVAAALEQAFRDGVLSQRPVVVNLQCDIDHPTQTLADLMHVADHFGGLERLRGKKLAMSWAYSPSYGKPLSVPQGVIGLLTRFGMRVTLAHPEGYGLMPDVVETARRQAAAAGGSFEVTGSMAEAFDGADVVYPKSWAPARVMHERTRLLRAGETARLGDLEREALANNARFRDWECTERMMQLTRGGRAEYMHCLPADVTGVSCQAGEVSANVFERHRLQTYREAGHKPFVIAAMILLTRFENPAAVLRGCVQRAIPRRADDQAEGGRRKAETELRPPTASRLPPPR